MQVFCEISQLVQSALDGYKASRVSVTMATRIRVMMASRVAGMMASRVPMMASRVAIGYDGAQGL